MMQAGSSMSQCVSTGGATGGSDCIEGVAALVEAIGGLQQLGTVQVRLPVELSSSDAAAVQQLSGMRGQLLPSSLAACCIVETNLLSIVS
jgi:hypothetical protein